MQSKKLIEKLELDLSHYLIQEMCKSNPEKIASPEIFRYKGLTITPSTTKGTMEKTIAIQIGSLEAQFSISTCEKVSGTLPIDDEKSVMAWMKKKENTYDLRIIFDRDRLRRNAMIVPFDLEEPYYRGLL